MSKKEKILLAVSLVGVGVAGYFGFKHTKALKHEIELLKQDVGHMYQEFAENIGNIDADMCWLLEKHNEEMDILDSVLGVHGIDIQKTFNEMKNK